ncbi:MAG: hypothetical protein ACP5OK_07535 [Thermoprotei archaeon]
MLVRSVHQNCEKTLSNYQHTRILNIKSTSKTSQNNATKHNIILQNIVSN